MIALLSATRPNPLNYRFVRGKQRMVFPDAGSGLGRGVPEVAPELLLEGGCNVSTPTARTGDFVDPIDEILRKEQIRVTRPTIPGWTAGTGTRS